MNYELCSDCGKPLINEENLKILKIIIGLSSGGMIIGGGLLGAAVLPALGFGLGGITGGSIAASIQGPAVVAGSLFAICQSLGATGLGIILFGAVGSAVGGVGALGLLYKNRDLIGWCNCD